MGMINFFKGKTNDGNSKVIMIHYSGLPSFPKKAICDMILNPADKTLIFKIRNQKDAPQIILPLSKIKSADNIKMTVQQSKVEQAIAGGILFGKIGAIIGAMTADERESLKAMYVITYNSDEEEKHIILKENGNLNFNKFQKELKEYLPLIPETYTNNITL